MFQPPKIDLIAVTARNSRPFSRSSEKRIVAGTDKCRHGPQNLEDAAHSWREDMNRPARLILLLHTYSLCSF